MVSLVSGKRVSPAAGPANAALQSTLSLSAHGESMSLSALELCRIARTARRLFLFRKIQVPSATLRSLQQGPHGFTTFLRLHSDAFATLLLFSRLPSDTFCYFLLLSVAFSTLPVSFSNSDCLQRNFWVGPRAIVIATFVWHPESLRQSLSNDLWHLVTTCDNWGPLQIWSSHQNVESQDCRKNPPTTLHRYHDHLALSTFLFWDQWKGRMDGLERFSKSATYNTYWTLKLKKNQKINILSHRSAVSLHWDPSRPPRKASMYSLRIQIAS